MISIQALNPIQNDIPDDMRLQKKKKDIKIFKKTQNLKRSMKLKSLCTLASFGCLFEYHPSI